ncbi:MAG TPA: substrate-binding domain-containing protein [Casimicrobiaceae bacterium]
MTPRHRSLHLLSAGAAQGLVEALQRAFEAEAGVEVAATFDAAGAIRDALVADAPCDVVILPATMQSTLAAEGRVDGATVLPLGGVPTGIAVASGDRLPAVGNAGELRATLLAAPALYCPDTVRATAGIHFAGVLRALGIDERSTPKLRAFPNGARAMAALAATGPRGGIGCTQVSEILRTPGVVPVAPLPAPFELTTVYAIAVSRNADNAAAARAFAARVTGRETEALRRAGGFLASST